MAAAAVDVHATVTVKQHGFHVKQPLQAARVEVPFGAAGAWSAGPELSTEFGGLPSPSGGSGAPPLPPLQRDEGSVRGLLSLAPPSSSAQPLPVLDSLTVAAAPASFLEPAEHAHLSNGVKRLMKSVVRGLKACQDPEAAGEGLGGTYFFSNEAGQKIAIMKPCDEEPLAPNNPKGFVGRALGEPGLKPTVRVGEAAAREVAAYLLDHGRFARVPHTVMVRMAHPVFHVQQQQLQQQGGQLPAKLGSLQQFVAHECDTSEMGASRFSVRDVQRIGILDLRLFNTDRHAGNMLVRRPRPLPSQQRLDGGAALMDLNQQYELVPIDHGFALPEALEPPYLEWQHWPQAMMPFGREELEYIAALDASADIEMLKREVPSLRVESLRVLEVCTHLLQACAAAGLTLAEIAGVVTRALHGVEEEPSELERVCFNARAEVEEISDEELVEAEESEESEGEADFVAMLSVEEEVPEEFACAGSPTFSSASDATAFKMSLTASEASRLEDALFCMDEESGASRTPDRARSPDAHTLAARLPPSRFAAEAGRGNGGSGGAPPPVTPVAMAGLGAAVFATPSTPGAEDDSLPASFDSMSIHGSGGLHGAGGSAAQLINGNSGTLGSDQAMAPSSLAPSAFYRAASYAPARRGGGPQRPPGGSGGTDRHSGRRLRSRRKLAIGSRLLKLTAQNYPPPVEARGGRSSSSALAVFRDLTEDQWERFMASVRRQVARKLRDGTWRQAQPAKAPLMSCPRF